MKKGAMKAFLKRGALLGATIAMLFSASVVGATESASGGAEKIEQTTATGSSSQVNLNQWKKQKVVLKAISNTEKGVEITWKPLAGSDNYYIYGKKPGKKWKLLKKQSASLCKFVYDQGKSGETYIFSVRAGIGSARSGYDANGLKIMYLAAVKPTKPQNTSDGLKISWKTVNGAKTYNVYRKEPGGSFKKIAKTKSVSYVDTKAENGKTYSYAVRAYNGKTKAFYKESAVGIRLAPTKFTACTENGAKTYDLKWKKNSKGSGYQIGYTTDIDGLKTINVSGPKVVTKTLSGFKAGRTYYLYIRSYKTLNGKTYYSAWSPAITVSNMSGLEKAIRATMSQYSADWSVYVKDLSTGQIVNINEHAMYPASVIKIAIMAGVFDQIKKGNLSYDANIQNLLWNMVTLSNNECANRLVQACGNGNWTRGCTRINELMSSLGMKNTAVHRALQPAQTLGSDGKGRNSFSAHDTVILMEKIYNNQLIDKWSSKEMMNLLLNQQVRNNIIRSIPAGIKIASKSGDADANHNDVAIIWGPKTTYIISIFSEQNSSYGIVGIKDISTVVYNYLNK